MDSRRLDANWAMRSRKSNPPQPRTRSRSAATAKSSTMSTLQPRKRRSLSRNCPRAGFNVSGTFRNRGQFWRSSRPLIRSGGKSGDFLAHTHLFFKVHRQEVARPEHQPRRCLGTRERHGRALVADFGVRKPLAGFGVPDAQHRPRRSRSPAFVGDALRHEMIWSIAERTGVSESARLPFAKAKESSLFENPSNRFGRPGPPAYSRAIWLNFSRSLLSGMENKARKTHTSKPCPERLSRDWRAATFQANATNEDPRRENVAAKGQCCRA